MGQVKELIRKDIKLPSPPAIAVRLMEAIRKENFSYRDFAGIINSDPALSAKILKIANSSFYSLPQTVNTIERAISVLGVTALKNIALSFVLSANLRGKKEGRFDYDYFWKRSITAAVAAELVAPFYRYKSDDLFVTALLQDIGVVFLHLSDPEEYARLLEEKRGGGKAIEVLERQYFGSDHPEVGAEILKKWGIAEKIHAPILCHHAPASAPEEYGGIAEILSLSDNLSSLYHGGHTADRIRKVRETLAQRVGIGEEEIGKLVDSVAGKTVEILSSFEIDPGKMKPFSEILQEANEELVRLNMSYEMLVYEYKKAKEQAESLAQELWTANEKLRDIAIRDGMTGLYNHRHFKDLLDQEYHRATRYARPLSLLIADIDHFKRINDTYGHVCGDHVIMSIGTVIGRTVGARGKTARYGGEEFAVLLPETDLDEAVRLAETLRRGIESFPFSFNGSAIRETISVGVAFYNPGEGDCNRSSRIVEAADQAMYAAKKSGRNRVRHITVPVVPHPAEMRTA